MSLCPSSDVRYCSLMNNTVPANYAVAAPLSLQIPCDECGAVAGENCRPGCTGQDSATELAHQPSVHRVHVARSYTIRIVCSCGEFEHSSARTEIESAETAAYAAYARHFEEATR